MVLLKATIGKGQHRRQKLCVELPSFVRYDSSNVTYQPFCSERLLSEKVATASKLKKLDLGIA